VVGLSAAAACGVLLLWASLGLQTPAYDAVVGPHVTAAQPMDLFFDHHYVSVRPRTRLEIEPATSGSARLRLETGEIACVVEPLETGADFMVRTPQTEVRVVGTQFRVEVHGPCTLVAVREGVVEVGTERLEAGASTEVCDPAPTPESARPGAEAVEEDELMRRAMDAVARGDHAEAEAWFQRYRREHPEGAFVEDALFQEGVAASRRGADARLRAIIEEMKARFPDSPRLKTLEELQRK